MTKIINNDQQSYGSILENQNKGSIFKSDYTPFSKAKKVSSKDDINNPNRFKLGTFSGCFIPTILNIISILMFLRFGHIISLLGVSGTFVILIISYLIDVLTTLSISAIATNGIVPGGGVYVIICRSLGIEFGGGIGIVFFLGQVLNSGMNCVGMFEPINNNFGPMLNNTLSDNNGFWLNSIILFFSFVICLIGSDIVSKLGNVLAVVLTSAIISIPITTFFKGPAYSNDALIFTGLSWNTFYMNFWPDWELLHLNKTETINSLFGLFFCATAGIFSGAGMSSELRKPSKSIPKGTLYGLFVTFISYAVVILSLSSSIPRNVMYKDYQIIQSTSVFPMLIVLGEISTSLFSIIVGLIGSGYVLDAISKDEILPGLKKIKLHTKKNLSLLIAYALTQLCLFSDVNKIANFVTMSFLLTFIVTNLACFLLEVSAAPNFRPSFKYFNRYTCLLGGILSIAAMFVVDGQQALTIMLLLLVLMLIIHYTVPPKFFGDVSQNLIYHQVRKYLLKIKINDNIKYWRPQILLLINDPNHEKNWRLMNFCNDLKKSGLYILGHILIQDNLEDEEEKIFKEYEKEVYRWEKIRDMAKLKAFIHVSIANSVQWGIRNLYLGSGLGGMKPNITILGLYGEGNTIRKELSLNMDPDSPTLDSQKWVRIVEDLSLMKSNIAIAKGFDSINIPDKADKPTEKKYIDLYPIQMSNNKKKFNFDTCTLIMQLGALLKTVPKWHKTHKLRCITFVEFEYERSDEYKKLNELLSILRIECDIIILCLQDFGVYNTILKGDSNNKRLIDVILKDDPWWQELKNVRDNLHIQYRRHSLAPSSAKIDVNLHQSYKKLRHLSKYGVSLGNKVPGDEDSDEDEDTSISSEASNIKEYVQKKLKADSDISSNKDMVNPVFSSDQLPKTQIFETPFSSQPTLGFVDEENRLGSSVMTKKGSLMLQPTMSPKQNSNYTEYLNGLSFNNLPRNVQFLILNDIFLSVSPDHITNLILTTLPLPIENTFKNKVLSEKYVEDLNIWLMDSQKDINVKMPAALLINSQTMTVTTAL